ncbi:MAG: hypothetical protein E6R03_02195 [Hyphomicrobiaceae bacterium]|nr:MAG: hypothetical protein E6R03_02195 [Hyphomicrobiaceae bacterium]
MPFSSKFQAQFIGGVLPQLRALLVANLDEAAQAIDGDARAVVAFDTPIPLTTVFPSVYVSPVASALDQSADDQYIGQDHTFFIDVALDGRTPDAATDALLLYMRAVDQVLRSATDAELFPYADAAEHRLRSRLAWEVTEHRFDILRTDGTQYRRDGRLTFRIQLIER